MQFTIELNARVIVCKRSMERDSSVKHNFCLFVFVVKDNFTVHKYEN